MAGQYFPPGSDRNQAQAGCPAASIAIAAITPSNRITFLTLNNRDQEYTKKNEGVITTPYAPFNSSDLFGGGSRFIS